MTSDEIKLRIIPTAEGYYDALRNVYFYNYIDHLGNVRLSYSDRDGNNEVTGDIVVNNCYTTPEGQMCNNYILSGEAEGVTNYYPFGMMHTVEYNTFDNAYLYKYNGKELQETGMYDYGARFYMPDLGRWGVVDPLAESSRRFTPYHYGNNNPIRFIDPDGRLTMDNLSTFSNGSAVADFINKNGFGEDYLPMFYRDDAGMMIVNQSLGDDGQGGGGGNSGGGNGGTPGPSVWQSIGNFFRNLFGGKKSTSSGHAVKATIISMTLIPEGAAEGSFFTSLQGVGTGLFSTAGLTAGAIFVPTMIGEPEFDWTRGLTRDIPITTTGEPDFGNLYLYRIMKNVNGMPMVGEGLDKLGLRNGDVNELPNSTPITPLFPNGLSVSVGSASFIPPNVPDFTKGKGTLFRVPASSLISYGLIGMPVPNPRIPNYGQIRPAIPMNVGTFRTLIQSTAPAWQPVK